MEQPKEEEEEEEDEDGESWHSLTPAGHIWVVQDTSWKNKDLGLSVGTFQNILE